MSDSVPPTDAAPSRTADPSPPRGWRLAWVWGERIVTAGLLVFLFIRVGPQFGALLGVGPDQGRAPDYVIRTLTGEEIRSADLMGSVVVLNFWATWCGPCKLEMPSLQSLHDDRADDGVVVLGLATDGGGDEGIRAFLAERGIDYPIGRATPGQRSAFGGISGIPTTFIIDRAGVVRHRVVGYFAPPAMRAAVSRLLAATPSAGTTSGP